MKMQKTFLVKCPSPPPGKGYLTQAHVCDWKITPDTKDFSQGFVLDDRIPWPGTRLGAPPAGCQPFPNARSRKREREREKERPGEREGEDREVDECLLLEPKTCMECSLVLIDSLCSQLSKRSDLSDASRTFGCWGVPNSRNGPHSCSAPHLSAPTQTHMQTTHRHTHAGTHIQTLAHTYMCTHMQRHACRHTQAHTHEEMYADTQADTHEEMYADTQAHTCRHRHARTLAPVLLWCHWVPATQYLPPPTKTWASVSLLSPPLSS